MRLSNNSNNKKKPGKQEKLRRLVALLMVIFLLLSVLATAIYYLTLPLSAVDEKDIIDLFFPEETENDDSSEETTDEDLPDDEPTTDETTASDDTDETDRPDEPPFSNLSVEPEYASGDDRLVRVGLMYGSNVTVGFETVAPYGFFINKVNRTGDLSSEPLWEIDDLTKVSCIVDSNLGKTGMSYYKTSDPSNTVVGGWHIEFGNDLSLSDVSIYMTGLESYLNELGIYAIPSYIDGGYRLRAGQFSTEAAAAECAAKLLESLPEFPVTVAAPTKTAVSLVDPLTDKILFEYDDGDTTALGLTAKPSPEGETAYLVTPAKKLYAGTFMFRRYIEGNVDGVSLTDIIKLGDYVKGVISYEISPSWPLEAQKAFSICVRSFVLAGVRHEASYQVDVCNSQHCQVYGGMTRVNDRVNQAVEETAGLVMTYDNEIVQAYYSAVTGGVTVSCYDEWGFKHIPYLVAVQTPWEIYTNHSEGAWQTEVSPSALCSYLNSKGYTSLRGEIKSINIDQLAENSTYVRQITFTDTYGNKATVKTCEKVRLSLSKYVNSANFVVGKGEVEAEQTTFFTQSPEDLNIKTADTSYPVSEMETVTVLSASGQAEITADDAYTLTAKGKIKLSGTSSTTETVTVKASNANNFIFVGKGWGHGVGLSQIGVRDLADLGYPAEEILPKYFTGIEIKSLDELNQ